MTRFGLARGARAETLAGLSGLGDLVLTCSSTDSRNFSLGKGLGEGRAARDLLTNRRTVAEGARSEEHTSELQSLMRISYAVFCLKKKKQKQQKAKNTVVTISYTLINT